MIQSLGELHHRNAIRRLGWRVIGNAFAMEERGILPAGYNEQGVSVGIGVLGVGYNGNYFDPS